MFELQHELTKAQNEAASAKEELNSSQESCEKLQELLQVKSQWDSAHSYALILSQVLLSVKSVTGTLSTMLLKHFS